MSYSYVISSDFPEFPLPDCNIWTYIHPYLEKCGNLKAWVCSETSKSLTYKEFCDSSLRWARNLLQYFQNGVPPRVAIISPNAIEIPVVFLGSAAVGATFVPINHSVHADLGLYMLRETTPDILVIDESVTKKFSEVIEKYGGVRKIFVRSPSGKSSFGEDLYSIIYSQKEILNVEEAKKIDPKAVAVLTFSSGTTGKPKGILLSHRVLVNTANIYKTRGICPFIESTESHQDVTMATLPLAHIYGLGYFSLSMAVTGTLVVNLDPKKTKTEEILKLMEKYKPHVIHCYPTITKSFSQAEAVNKAFERVRCLVNVGSLHDPKAFKELKEKAGNNMVLQECYGTTEIGPLIMTPVDKGRLGVTGRVSPHGRVRFADLTTGAPITEPFRPGEMFIQTPRRMIGYHNNPKATEAVFDKDNWFQTADVGYFDQDNYIVVVERNKDIISVNGEVVYPSKIETILKQHEAVFDVGVIGIHHTETGDELPKAFVVRSRPVEEQELVNLVEKKGSPEMRLLGGVQFVESLPRNYLGKLVRRDLREMVWFSPKT